MKRSSWGKLLVSGLGLAMVHSSMAAAATPAEATELDALWAGIAAGVLALGLMSYRLRR
ncbi:MAG: hypothetical protein J0M20_01025 [Burkholderiales bacterium]|nr:hypothetical protein [Burkholderiales bacterium]